MVPFWLTMFWIFVLPNGLVIFKDVVMDVCWIFTHFMSFRNWTSASCEGSCTVVGSFKVWWNCLCQRRWNLGGGRLIIGTFEMQYDFILRLLNVVIYEKFLHVLLLLLSSVFFITCSFIIVEFMMNDIYKPFFKHKWICPLQWWNLRISLALMF